MNHWHATSVSMQESYFQFPISALRLDLQSDNRWGDVLELACFRYGTQALTKTPPEEVSQTVKRYLARFPNVIADRKSPEHQALVFAYDRLGIIAGSGALHSRIKSARRVERECSNAPFPIVRIKAAFWWDTFTPDGRQHHLSFREFVVLCAVYAAIGAKPYTKASLHMIRRFAAGYPNFDEFEVALAQDRKGSLFLTIKQARTTLGRLEALRFFAKVTYNNGECFYSNKMSRDALQLAIYDRKLRKRLTVADHRREDLEFSKAILQSKAGLSAQKRSAQNPF